MNQDAPIGIFDSGIGGLTVVKEIRRLLPEEDIIYVGDTARVPYGSRDPEEILAFMRQFFRFFERQKVKLAVYACNTMTAYGFSSAKGRWPFELVAMNSGVGEAIGASSSRRVGVIATQGTINNRMHWKSAKSLDETAEIVGVACPEFVPLIESGKISGPEIEAAAQKYMARFQGARIGALILGCTHYPLIERILRGYLEPETSLINPARATAADAVRALDRADGRNPKKSSGALNLYFSAELDRARAMTELVLHARQAEFHLIDLEDYRS